MSKATTPAAEPHGPGPAEMSEGGTPAPEELIKGGTPASGRKNFSLRARLFLLLGLALVSLAVPLILLTVREMTRVLESRETDALANVLDLVEDGIAARYFALLTGKAGRVMDIRKQLRGAALSGRTLWRILDGFGEGRGSPPAFGGRRRLYMEILGGLAEAGPALQLYDRRGRPLAAFGEAFDLTGLADRKGRSLARITAREALAEEGDFAVFTTSAENRAGEAEIVLAYFLPLPGRDLVLAALVALTDIEREAAENLADLIDSTRERLERLNFSENGFLSVLAAGREVVVHRGHPYWAEAGLWPTGSLEISRRNEAEVFKFEVPVPTGAPPEVRAGGGMIFFIGYFKALDWHLIAAAPKDELAAPAKRLAREQAAMALGVTLLVAALALIPAARLVRPLRLLTRKASLLPTLDFTAPETESLFREGLPTSRRDEVGGLARSFSLMGQALSKSIRELMAATAAQERIEGELSAAREIQMGILPPLWSLGLKDETGRTTVTLAARLEPAREVGGDLFDFFTTADGRQALVIGDVSGKGVPAALFMAMTVTLVRSALRAGLDPAAAMSRVNEILSLNNPRSMFVTLFIGLLDPANGALDFANGGHCRPLVWGGPENGDLRVLTDLSGPPVGVMEGVSYKLFGTRLYPGQRCLLFTDGVTEAQNGTEEFFGAARLAEFCREDGRSKRGMYRPEEGGREGFLIALQAALLDFQGPAPQGDDITLLHLELRA